MYYKNNIRMDIIYTTNDWYFWNFLKSAKSVTFFWLKNTLQIEVKIFMFLGSNFCVFGPIDLILALINHIYLQFDDPEGILGKNWKFQTLEPKKQFWLQFGVCFWAKKGHRFGHSNMTKVVRSQWVVAPTHSDLSPTHYCR